MVAKIFRYSDREGGDIIDEDEDQQDVSSGDASGNEEADEGIPTERPYNALLQSLAVDLTHHAKRRKLESSAEQEVVKQKEEYYIAHEEQDSDHVDEEEEGPETAVDEFLEENEHDIEDALDPFEARFANPDNNIISSRLQLIQRKHWTIQKSYLTKASKAVIGIPEEIEEEEVAQPAAISGPTDLKLKQRLARSLGKVISTFDSLEQAIAPFLFNYHDILFCERSPANCERLRRLVCLHAVNHIYKYAFPIENGVFSLTN